VGDSAQPQKLKRWWKSNGKSGGYLQDFDANGTLASAGGLVFSANAKYEHWNFPLLAATSKNNVSAFLQVIFRPLAVGTGGGASDRTDLVP
jgi:hypothetical protein